MQTTSLDLLEYSVKYVIDTILNVKRQYINKHVQNALSNYFIENYCVAQLKPRFGTASGRQIKREIMRKYFLKNGDAPQSFPLVGLSFTAGESSQLKKYQVILLGVLEEHYANGSVDSYRENLFQLVTAEVVPENPPSLLDPNIKLWQISQWKKFIALIVLHHSYFPKVESVYQIWFDIFQSRIVEVSEMKKKRPENIRPYKFSGLPYVAQGSTEKAGVSGESDLNQQLRLQKQEQLQLLIQRQNQSQAANGPLTVTPFLKSEELTSTGTGGSLQVVARCTNADVNQSPTLNKGKKIVKKQSYFAQQQQRAELILKSKKILKIENVKEETSEISQYDTKRSAPTESLLNEASGHKKTSWINLSFKQNEQSSSMATFESQQQLTNGGQLATDSSTALDKEEQFSKPCNQKSNLLISASSAFSTRASSSHSAIATNLESPIHEQINSSFQFPSSQQLSLQSAHIPINAFHPHQQSASYFPAMMLVPTMQQAAMWNPQAHAIPLYLTAYPQAQILRAPQMIIQPNIFQQQQAQQFEYISYPQHSFHQQATSQFMS